MGGDFVGESFNIGPIGTAGARLVASSSSGGGIFLGASPLWIGGGAGAGAVGFGGTSPAARRARYAAGGCLICRLLAAAAACAGSGGGAFFGVASAVMSLDQSFAGANTALAALLEKVAALTDNKAKATTQQSSKPSIERLSFQAPGCIAVCAKQRLCQNGLSQNGDGKISQTMKRFHSSDSILSIECEDALTYHRCASLKAESKRPASEQTAEPEQFGRHRPRMQLLLAQPHCVEHCMQSQERTDAFELSRKHCRDDLTCHQSPGERHDQLSSYKCSRRRGATRLGPPSS